MTCHTRYYMGKYLDQSGGKMSKGNMGKNFYCGFYGEEKTE